MLLHTSVCSQKPMFHTDHVLYEWGSDIKFSSLSSNSRGVAILFRNTFQYHIEKEIKDSDGNFIILSVRINNTLWTLVAVCI
jgi:hypothetical protein